MTKCFLIFSSHLLFQGHNIFGNKDNTFLLKLPISLSFTKTLYFDLLHTPKFFKFLTLQLVTVMCVYEIN